MKYCRNFVKTLTTDYCCIATEVRRNSQSSNMKRDQRASRTCFIKDFSRELLHPLIAPLTRRLPVMFFILLGLSKTHQKVWVRRCSHLFLLTCQNILFSMHVHEDIHTFVGHFACNMAAERDKPFKQLYIRLTSVQFP